MEHAHTHTVAEPEPTKPIFTRAETALLIPTALATLAAILWPAGHLTYKHQFDSPDAWWVLVLMTLAGWIMTLHEFRADKSRTNQRQIIDSQSQILAELAELRADTESYGDARERAGHALAMAARNGTVRQLHPVD